MHVYTTIWCLFLILVANNIHFDSRNTLELHVLRKRINTNGQFRLRCHLAFQRCSCKLPYDRLANPTIVRSERAYCSPIAVDGKKVQVYDT